MNYDLFRARCSHGTRGKRKLNKKKFQGMYKNFKKIKGYDQYKLAGYFELSRK